MIEHPCLSCGACCAYYRVLFYWREGLSDWTNVPAELTVDINQFTVGLKGTLEKRPRCQALVGKIGDKAQCQIYERRPTPCREFKPSFENGERNLRCEEARSKFGLKPLHPMDWQG